MADLSQIQFGDVATWVSGVGALFAGGTALWIAGRDRRDRERERQDESKSQARLVVAGLLPGKMRDHLSIANFSQAPVFSVQLLAIDYPNRECETHWPRGDLTDTILTQLLQPLDDIMIGVNFVAGGNLVSLSKPGPITVRFAFTDVNGLRWERAGDGPPVRVHD